MILQELVYGSEYIVASYGTGTLDLHFGLGWGHIMDPNINLRTLLNI